MQRGATTSHKLEQNSNYLLAKIKLVIRRNNMKYFATLLIVSVLTGCAQSGVYRENRNEIIETYYATVDSVEIIKLQSKAAEGAVLGGVTGLVDNLDGNTEEMVAGTIIGALIGGLFTGLYESIFDGGHTAYQYQLTTKSNAHLSVIVSRENKHEIGQCVRVSKSEKVSLHAAHASLCEPKPLNTLASN